MSRKLLCQKESNLITPSPLLCPFRCLIDITSNAVETADMQDNTPSDNRNTYQSRLQIPIERQRHVQRTISPNHQGPPRSRPGTNEQRTTASQANGRPSY